jgi:hypothetical protein
MLPLKNCPVDENAFLEVALRGRQKDQQQSQHVSLSLSKAHSVESSETDKIDSLKEEVNSLTE